MTLADRLTRSIRTIPDYPKPGILFRDITTLLGDGEAFALAIDALAAPFRAQPPEAIVGLEARGFIIGGAVAHALGVGFVPMRKKGKLPFATVRQAYALEYGTDELELHTDALRPGARVVVVDDLIATGGTAGAACSLLARVGATVLGASFVIDLPDLGGAARLAAAGVTVRSLVAVAGH
jgi:adenine phosphoribosyltransferase